MRYCSKCGREIIENEPEITDDNSNISDEASVEEKEEQVQTETADTGVDLEKKEKPKKSNPMRVTPPPPTPQPVKPSNKAKTTLGNGIKVLLSAVVALVPGAGAVLGIVLGLVYMSHKEEDYRTFGRALVILGVVMIALGILCCLILMIIGIMDSSSSPDMYYHEFNDMLRVQ